MHRGGIVVMSAKDVHVIDVRIVDYQVHLRRLGHHNSLCIQLGGVRGLLRRSKAALNETELPYEQHSLCNGDDDQRTGEERRGVAHDRFPTKGPRFVIGSRKHG
jgi:hypothetical protein